MDIKLCTEGTKQWDSYVASERMASAFHRWRYRQVVVQTYSHRPYYLAAWRDGDICGVLPLFLVTSRLFGRFLVSLPFVDYGGICADDEEATAALLQEAKRIADREGARSLELRQCHAGMPELAAKTSKVNLVLELYENADAVWERLDGKVRNQVRKAVKSGLSFEVGGPEKLTDFYRVWSQNMRDLGTPAYPFGFFSNFLNCFQDDGEVLIVRRGRKPVGAGIAVYHKDTMEIPWASSLREYFSYCPNNLLYWEGIRRACLRGSRSFHFGRSTLGSNNYRFKKQWGAVDQPLYYYFYSPTGSSSPDLDPHGAKYSLAVRAWKQLPVAVANVLGPWIVRGIP